MLAPVTQFYWTHRNTTIVAYVSDAFRLGPISECPELLGTTPNARPTLKARKIKHLDKHPEIDILGFSICSELNAR